MKVQSFTVKVQEHSESADLRGLYPRGGLRTQAPPSGRMTTRKAACLPESLSPHPPTAFPEMAHAESLDRASVQRQIILKTCFSVSLVTVILAALEDPPFFLKIRLPTPDNSFDPTSPPKIPKVSDSTLTLELQINHIRFSTFLMFCMHG